MRDTDDAASPAGSADLLLLPGTLCDERVFAPLLTLLPDWPATVAAMAGASGATAMAERILSAAPPRFALLGFSLGAIVAVEIALLAPERVLGLAIVGGNLRAVPVADHAARRAAVVRATVDGTGRHVVDELWPRYVAPAAANDEALRTAVEAMADTLGHRAYAAQTEMALGRVDRREWLSALTMPALVLCGAQDEVASAAVHREVAALLPGAALAIVPDAGHFVLLERPDAVAQHVAAWLDRIALAGTNGGDGLSKTLEAMSVAHR